MEKIGARVLIVGGGGFIGAWLAKYLVEEDCRVTVVDPFKTLSRINSDLYFKITKFRMNKLLTNIRLLDSYFDLELLDKTSFDIVFHLAAFPLESKEIEVSEFQIFNDIPTTFHIAEMFPYARIVFLSSVFVYGSFEKEITERYRTAPETVYGSSKLISEQLIRNLTHNWVIIRTTSVYGFGDANLRASQQFVTRAIYNERKETAECIVSVNKKAKLQFIYIDDLVDGIVAAGFSDAKNEIYHIAGDQLEPLENFIVALQRYFPKLKYRLFESEDRPRRGKMSISKAQILLGWHPKISLESGVKKYVKIAKAKGFG